MVAAGVSRGVDAVAVRVPIVPVLQQGALVRLLDVRPGWGRLALVGGRV
ncbi:hypothetical protein AmDm5_1865 [Acetobacter malorum]|nr:hypothetical protein AmDm5_1865 [Acetobacter malorum]